MPTPPAADYLRLRWRNSSAILTDRLLALDELADNLALVSCGINTVRELKSFVTYLADQRQAAWTRYWQEHRIALQASGFR